MMGRAWMMGLDAWHDDEITDPRDDAFERVEYAKRAASLIVASYDRESSTVFGLVGPWGCGKSTLTNFICSEITSMDDADWKVLRFTPWAAADANSLLGEFFATLSSAFPASTGQRLRRHLGRLAAISAPIVEMIPIAGGAASKAAELTAEHLAAQKPWSEAFESVSEELIKQGVPVLIVVDDVDRLHGAELLTLLKVVRLLGRFPGIQYLLAYDDLTLFRSIETQISESGGVTGRDFLEKIVQYPLAVPMLTPVQKTRRLNKGLERVQERGNRAIGSLDRVEELLDVFSRQLATPRSIDRWAAQVGYQFTLLDGNEVDDQDVLILTLLRSSSPQVYAMLSTYKQELLDGRRKSTGSSSPEVPDPLAPLLDLVPERDRSDVGQILRNLFPQCSRYGEKPRGGTRRMAEIQYFDRYLSQTVTSDDVSDLEIRESVLAAANGSPDSLWTFLASGDVERQLLAAEKASRVDLSSVDGERLADFAAYLVSKLEDLPKESKGLYRGARPQVLRWAATLIARISPDHTTDRICEVLLSGGELGVALEVWRSSAKVIDPSERGEGPDWALAVTAEMNRLAVEHVTSNLRQGDDAPRDVIWPLNFLLAHQGEDALKESLRTGLSSGAFTIEDVAARFVSTSRHYSSDGEEQMSSVDRISFADVMPIDDDPWFDESIDYEVDVADLSWSSKRLFARGRFRRPEAE